MRDRPDIVFGLEDLPDCVQGVCWPYDDGVTVIAVDRRLGRRQRKSTLAHELIHTERGGGVRVVGLGVAAARHIVELEERRVDDEVARRLVPLDELAQLVASICDDGTPIHAWEIAEAFDVPDDVAIRACELLKREGAA